MTRLLRHRWLARLALAVLLLAALAPTVSRALLRAGQAVVWMEVCTASGPQRIALTSDSKPAPATPLLDACPLCVLGCDRWGPPVVAGLFHASAHTPPAPDVAAPVSVRVAPLWAAQPRGPPTRSYALLVV